jgi:hypothetical protein
MGSVSFILWGSGPPQAADSTLILISPCGAIHICGFTQKVKVVPHKVKVKTP